MDAASRAMVANLRFRPQQPSGTGTTGNGCVGSCRDNTSPPNGANRAAASPHRLQIHFSSVFSSIHNFAWCDQSDVKFSVNGTANRMPSRCKRKNISKNPLTTPAVDRKNPFTPK
jgi:hypothetical protein